MEKISVYSGKSKMYLTFPYDKQTVDYIKTKLNFRKFTPKTLKHDAYWEAGYTIENVNFILNNDQFEYKDDKSKQILQMLKLKFHENQTLQCPGLNYDELNLPLKDYQKIAMDYIIANNGALVGDDMGLGKSLEVLAAIEWLNRANVKMYPCLIICPKTLKYNWHNEIMKWIECRATFMIGTNTKNLKDFDTDYYEYMIINYDLVNKFRDQLCDIQFCSLIVDECQYIKNRDAQRTKDIIQIASTIEFKTLLSGTPTPNRPIELITQLQALDKLKYIGSQTEFINRYCDPQSTPWGLDVKGASNMEELNKILKSVCMIRRTKQQVAKELPPKQKINIPVEITNREEYNRAEAEFLDWLKAKVKEELMKEGVMELAAERMAIRKMLKAKYAEFLVKMEKLKQLTVAGKLESFYEWLDIFLETGNKIYVSAIHRDIQHQVWERYHDISEHIFSEDSEMSRDQAITSIKNNPNKKILVASLKCTKEGLNLQFLHDFAFLELDWVPSTHEQAEARGHRIGQTETVNCYYFTGLNTVDDKIWEMLENKQGVIDQVLSPNAVDTKEEDVISEITKSLWMKSNGGIW